jgi:hypothetical protein
VNVRRTIAAIVFLTIWGLITHGTFAGSGDDPHYLVAAHSLAFDGDFDVANDYALEPTLIGGRELRPEDHARPGVGGALRPAHDVGLPLIFAPYVRIVYPLAAALARTVPDEILRRARLDGILILRHFMSLAMAVVAAALALQLYAIVRRHARSGMEAALWALLIVLSPPLLSLSFLFFTELPSALLVVWLFRVLSEPDTTRTRWWAVGAATGFLLLLHTRNAAVVLGMLAWGVVRLRAMRASQGAWASWAAAAGGVLLLRTAIVYTFWGTVLTTPLAVAGDRSVPLSDAMREMGVRAAGLLFDQEFGLLTYAPVYLLAAPALLRVRWRETPGVMWAIGLAAAYAATIVIPYINIHGWTGGWSPPARMIAPVVPLVAVVTAAWAVGTRGVARRVVFGLVALQVAIDLVIWQWPKALWNYGDGTSALLTSVPALQRLLPAWHGPVASAGPFVVAFACWAGVTAWLTWVSASTRTRVP